ncbi:glyoxylate/hydroxypyruvate reductase A [Alteromonadaceae bacterium BrNp21-10]|nr:glyoxylate/hydroxypyruvate reductase A [Alteromonadaceae bacterium BrNp21-10]
MSLSIICTQKDPQPWRQALLDIDANLDIQIWPHEADKQQVEFALCWKHPQGVLAEYPNLKCISSMGAGIDHFLKDAHFPQHVDAVRLIDPLLAQSMFEYVATASLNHFRDFNFYAAQQASGHWQRQTPQLIQNTTVGILGLGELGSYCASKLTGLGFNVIGWSNSAKQIQGITNYVGKDGLSEFLSKTDILVCLLPLTSNTSSILNLSLFKQLRPNAYLINVARGEHLVEQDLITAIDEGILSGACLDVFQQEPLPTQHDFWQHPKISVTPHCSSVTQAFSVAPQIVENYYAMCEGRPLTNRVDLKRGY